MKVETIKARLARHGARLDEGPGAPRHSFKLNGKVYRFGTVGDDGWVSVIIGRSGKAARYFLTFNDVVEDAFAERLPKKGFFLPRKDRLRGEDDLLGPLRERGDPADWLVFADWLEDHGAAARAKFLRDYAGRAVALYKLAMLQFTFAGADWERMDDPGPDVGLWVCGGGGKIQFGARTREPRDCRGYAKSLSRHITPLSLTHFLTQAGPVVAFADRWVERYRLGERVADAQKAGSWAWSYPEVRREGDLAGFEGAVNDMIEEEAEYWLAYFRGKKKEA